MVKRKGEIKHQDTSDSKSMFRRSIIGKTRDLIKSKLSTAHPIVVAHDLEQTAKQASVRVGNITSVPSVSAIRKMAQEKAAESRLDPDPFREVGKLAAKQNREIVGRKMNGHIQEISQIPFSVIMHSERQLEYCADICKLGNVRAHVDATGSLVRPIVSTHFE